MEILIFTFSFPYIDPDLFYENKH